MNADLVHYNMDTGEIIIKVLRTLSLGIVFGIFAIVFAACVRHLLSYFISDEKAKRFGNIALWFFMAIVVLIVIASICA